jgi:PKD repeat protein
LAASLTQDEPFTLFSGITHLEPTSFATLLGPFDADSGTIIKVSASSMVGESDVFLMTQNQYQLYSAGAAPARIEEGSMLLISEPRTVLYSISEELGGSNLYVVLDNKGGGGGVGLSPIATTVTVSLTPILDPRITDADSLAVIDVGSNVLLDASTTPNRSGQIATEGYLWDVDGDGFSDLAGIQVETSWSEPGDLTIYLRVIGVDGRPATKFHEISVVDISPPQAKIEGSQNITRAFGESISLRGTYSDNWNVVSVKWYLGESLVLTDPSPQKEGESVFDLEILIDQVQAGTHTIRMEVTDASGMTSNSTSNLTIYDATPPSVNDAIVEITRFTDETITLEALAVDLESESLGYSWDVDVNIDSDGDGITNNDMDRSGQTLTVTYEKAGIYSAICTVTNDNGLETNIEYIIAIEPAQTTPSLIDQIMPYLPIIGAISLVLLIAAALILIISIRARKKVKEIEEELRKQEQEQIQVPSESEQKEMFARNRDDGQSSFSYRRSPTTEISADPDIAALLGRKPSDMAQSRKNRPNDDLLSLMFEEENDGGEDATTDSENDETERSRPQIPQIPISEEIPGPSSISGSDRNDINEEEQPTDDQPSLGDAEELVQDLQMRVKCSECQAQFRVKIPDGAPGVRASCPTCGSLQVVRRP